MHPDSSPPNPPFFRIRITIETTARLASSIKKIMKTQLGLTVENNGSPRKCNLTGRGGMSGGRRRPTYGYGTEMAVASVFLFLFFNCFFI